MIDSKYFDVTNYGELGVTIGGEAKGGWPFVKNKIYKEALA